MWGGGILLAVAILFVSCCSTGMLVVRRHVGLDTELEQRADDWMLKEKSLRLHRVCFCVFRV